MQAPQSIDQESKVQRSFENWEMVHLVICRTTAKNQVSTRLVLSSTSCNLAPRFILCQP